MSTIQPIRIGKRTIGAGHPVFVIAEMSANHGHSYEQALELVRTAKLSGADAIKLQTYTPDTLTINCDLPDFQIGKGTLWEGKNLYKLYGEAYTPWEWQPKLKKEAEALGLICFSTPFDETAVAFLEQMEVPAHKIASFELVDTELLRAVARTGKPVIMSTGMATLEEIEEAVATLRDAGCNELALLKCTSAYPALPEEMNLRTIPDLAERFNCPVGLSDHTMGITAPAAAVALGATIIEKHFTLSRSVPGPDSAFSLEPSEFRAMVDAVRAAEQAMGCVNYSLSPHEAPSRAFRRSLYVVKDVQAGEPFTKENLRSIRPGYGLAPKHLDAILGKRALCDISRGTAMSWGFVEEP